MYVNTLNFDKLLLIILDVYEYNNEYLKKYLL